MDWTQILEATLSPDTQTIQLAQAQLEAAANENLPMFLNSLATELANVSKSQVSRMAAGLQLKNYLTSKDPDIKLRYQQRWLSFDPQVRAHIKNLVLSTLGTETLHLHSAAQCIAHIAAVELQVDQWPELIGTLLNNVTSAQSVEQLKEASLEAIGYVCEDLDPKFLASQSNKILTAIVQGMTKDEPSDRVKLAATKAMLNSLEFTKANFEKENERHFIMQVVCEATQNNLVAIQVAALQNLVKIMSLYYQYMESYMGPALFAITLEAMKNSTDEVALQGIEFWSTVCDEEMDLAIDAADAAETGHPPELTSRFYVRGAMQHLIPIILLTLAKQEDFDDEDDWNPCKAAGVCLSLLSNCCEDSIVAPVIVFVMQNLVNPDWKFRDAAVMALGSIMEGPDPDELQKHIVELIGPLLYIMEGDDTVQVKDSSAWAIGRICERCPAVLLNEQCLPLLLKILISSLSQEPRVAINVCWAFSSLAEAASDAASDGMAEDDDVPNTFCLSSDFDVILAELIKVTEKPDATSNLRSSAYEALMDMIKYSAKDCYPVIQKTTLFVLRKLKELLAITLNPLVSGAERQQVNDLESMLCATLMNLLRKVNKEDALAASDTVMEVLLGMLQSAANQAGGGVQEDALMSIGVLIEILGDGFLKYMEVFKPQLLSTLSNIKDVQVCLASVGLVGDLCRNLSIRISPFCIDLVEVLVNDLANADAHRSIKPPILSVLGDMALAIGIEFSPYLNMVLQILVQASQVFEVNVEKDNYDVIDYANELRDGILECYTGIVQGLKGEGQEVSVALQSMFSLAPTMITLIVTIAKDEDKSDSNLSNAIGLLGDLCTSFGSHLSVVVNGQPILTQLVNEGKRSRIKRTKTVSLWAAKELKKVQQSSPIP